MPSTPASVDPPVASQPGPRRLARLSLLAILVSALTGTASEICLKLGAVEMAAHPAKQFLLGITGLDSMWVWFGILFTIFSFLAWVRAIQAIPLSIAFTFSNVVHVLVPLSCWLILGEAISPRRWLGIALVVVGLFIVARPFAHLDEKLDEAL